MKILGHIDIICLNHSSSFFLNNKERVGKIESLDIDVEFFFVLLIQLINKMINLLYYFFLWRKKSRNSSKGFQYSSTLLFLRFKMNSTLVNFKRSSANYRLIIPISMVFSIISVFISCGILLLIYLTKRLHTISHILICNTCISSIFYCLVQGINYIYLIFLTSDTSDISCRYRAYFGYMSIASVIYSYFIQALSRYLFSIYHTKYRWILSFKIHFIIILIQWIIILLIPLPALLTNDINFRPTFLCWVPKEKILHAIYTLFVYYLIPITSIVIIYINIFYRVKQLGKTKSKLFKTIKQKRNLEILRNICILIGIYTGGGIPTLIYITIGIEIFYSIGIIFLSFTVTIERICIILLDREIRNIIRNYFSQTKTTIIPIINQQNKIEELQTVHR